MGKEDYIAAGGGPLKLKGVKDGRIEKKKKKKKDKERSKERERSAKPGSEEPVDEDKLEMKKAEDLEEPPLCAGKTEAERRFEEKRRKRLDERFMKEGVKSHKERVEEFNKYLANLSEHHDMPRIGPG